MKNFDEWNKIKKKVNFKTIDKYCKKRQIWWCALGVNIGFEQDGTNNDFERPVLILQTFSKFVCLIVPLTTSQKKSKYLIHIGVINNRSAQVIISQIRLIDTRRLRNKIGIIKENLFLIIIKTTKEMF